MLLPVDIVYYDKVNITNDFETRGEVLQKIIPEDNLSTTPAF